MVSSDLKALTNKEKIEKEEEIQRTDGHKKIHQTEEEEEEEAEDNELSENSYIEASQSLQSTMQSKSEKLKSIDAKQPFKKNLPVTSEMNSKSGVKETTQMRNVTSVSVFSEFDINLTAKAKSYKNPQNESSTISRYNVPNCLADNKKKGTNTISLSKQEIKGNDILLLSHNSYTAYKISYTECKRYNYYLILCILSKNTKSAYCKNQL